jgi:outer membrane receptor protein involved in Fe transport
VARKRLGARSDALVQQQNVALFGQEEVVVSRYFRFQVGVRADYFLFDVEDRLEDLTKLNGPRGSGYAQQTILSPKLNVVLSPTPHLDIYLNGGTGFHSNDARDAVLHADVTTVPRMIAGEVGGRARVGERLNVGLAFWRYDLGREFVYVGDEGTTEESGATRRMGADLEARFKLRPWLWGDWDLTLSRGRFKEAPEGENRIPLAPTMTSAGGLTLRHPRGYEGSLRFRRVGDRPANETGSVTARGYTLADLSLGYRTKRYQVGVTVENLLNARWNEAQFDTESRLRDEAESVSELHFTPGNPFDARIGVGFFF